MKLLCIVFVGCVSGKILSHECPNSETHRSCMFYAEYTCWLDRNRQLRVKTPAKRLFHCWGGCVCNAGTVRAYPKGPCIQSHHCRDAYFEATLAKLPPDFIYF